MSGRAATDRVLRGRFGISVNDPGHPTPPGWVRTPLTDIADLGTGHTPSRNHLEYWDGDVPWIGIRDAGAHHGGIIDKTAQTITPLGLENSAARLLPKDTVCLSRTASVGYVVKMGRDMATSQDFVTWTCSEALDPDFLMSALLAEGEDIRKFGEGSTHTTIYFPAVKAFHLDLPPITEQRRIVAKLDALTARIARARAELDRVPVLANRLRATALKDAVDGNLVTMSLSSTRWDVEKRVLIAARRQKYLTARRGSRISQDIPNEVTNLPGNRSSWLDCYLADVVDLRVGHAFKSADFSDSGIRLTRGANIAPGKVDWTDTVFLPESLSGSYAKYVLDAGDIVIAMDRPLISSGLKIAQLTDADAGALLVQRVANPRGTEFITQGYLYLILQSYLFLQQIENHATGSDLPHISANDLLTTRCPLPPIAVQNEITKVVDRAFARADRLEAEAARARKLLDRLESAILAKAFRGELVPQDANDEPAEKLLERIRAERAAAPKAIRGRKSRA
jgi:type I restriction enzyme S subunit